MSVLRWVLTGLTICVLGAPLAIGAAALSGIGHRWVDIMAQFTAPALMATLAVLVLALLLRLWVAGGAAGITALVLLVALWPQWAPPRGRPVAGAPVITLYSANTYVRNQDTTRIAASIKRADADIVVLVELARTPGQQIDTVLADYPYRYLSPVGHGSGGPSRSVIASRWPVVGAPDRPDELDAITAVVQTPLGPLNVVGAHLTRPWPYQFQWSQIIQTMNLTDVVKDLRGPVIVAGDFNSVSSARIGKQVQSDIGLIAAPGWPGTWPSALPPAFGFTIDQVYRSPDLALLDRRLATRNGSDHRAVITRFTLADGVPARR